VWAALVCGAVGALVALPALRLSGIYLALATAAFAVFLDRWFFTLPAFDIGPAHVEVFDLGIIAVRPLDIPGIDTTDKQTFLVVLSVVFALAYLLIVAVRRSTFGERLLAMKDSPAACATLGIDLTRLKLGVFAMSAALAGVGGALYAGSLGSVGYERFNLFESLPLLLLAVVGGIGTASGALFTGVVLGGFPIAAGIWPFLDNLNRVLPGTMGVALGRNPNGAVRDISGRYAILRAVPATVWGLALSLAAAASLAVTGVLTGWGLLFAGAGALVVWPGVADLVVARRRPADDQAPLERAGFGAPLTDEELRRVEAALGIDASDIQAVGA
jgi:branched-chain amino acid transport system permease protein